MDFVFNTKFQPARDEKPETMLYSGSIGLGVDEERC